jgi:beta-lactamase superfamily II metal-dependent hydrolase
MRPIRVLRAAPDMPTMQTQITRGRGADRRLPAASAGAAPLLAALLLGGCGAGATDPSARPPEITIAGVEDGRVYAAPVTISVTVDRGSWDATLNGARFTGGTVSAPGDYALVVTARDGAATATKALAFSIGLAGGSVLIFRMLDLGAAVFGPGDALVLTDSSASGLFHAVVDAGPYGPQSDANFVANRLRQLGIDTLAMLQLTHAHADHFGGMVPILTQLRVRSFVYNGQLRSMSSYNQVRSTAAARSDTVIVSDATHTVQLGGTRLDVLPPLQTWIRTDTGDGTQLNEGSLGTVVTKGSFRMFLTGDGEHLANARWRNPPFASQTRNLTMLKVGHHGANNAIFDFGSGATNTTSTWLAHTAPAVALISANGTTHPRQRATFKLVTELQIETYCTNVHGTIEVRVDVEGRYRIDVERNRDMNCVAGSEATT